MEDRRVTDYFVVAGLPDNPEPLEEFSCDGANLKPTHNQAPITDVAVIIRSAEEAPPEGYIVIENTISGFSADLNHGSIRCPTVFLCYRRGRDKPPLVDIGVLYEGKDRLLSDSALILETPYGKPANVNNGGSKTYITYRRALPTAPCNELVVTDICVILSNKGEVPPHTFCMIPKNLNKGMVGSDVFLCYKKSMNRANSLAFKPAVLGQFPLLEHADFPLPPSVPLFCLPMGATIECWPNEAQCPQPVFSTFVLTVSHLAEKVYGAAVTFYERYPEKKVTEEQREQLNYDKATAEKQTLNTNKCICILSHWPFFETFVKFLMFLYEMSISGPHTVPIERYVSHFMLEIPFPSPQRPTILIQLTANERISVSQPEDSPLSLSGASFKELLMNLGPDNCMMLLLYALTEQKILIHSLRPDVLTSVAEAVSMLIFPFHWQCPYIPLCPLGLCDVLNAPMPFIVGVDSRYFDLYDPPHDVICVDLDTNTISSSDPRSDDKKGMNVKVLPKKPARILRNTLQPLYERFHQLALATKTLANQKHSTGSLLPTDSEFKFKKQERAVEIEVQEAFLRFTATILKDFRSFLQPITKAPTIGATDCSSLFDMQGFLKSRDKAYHRFYQLLMRTQMFTRFIEERSFVSDKDASLAFFDECTEKVDIGVYPEPRLLEIEESHQSERTVFITPPEPIGLPADTTYTYQGFSDLIPSLFHEKHQLKTWTTPMSKSSPAPGSPLAKRTKQEIRSAQRIAKKHSEKPVLWSKCLVSYCYTLWFIHLPAYVKMAHSKAKALRTAYDVLVKMQAARLQPPDEVCYRVLMQLCGQYSQPVLAVKLLTEMKKNGVQPNAITYGYYNKAVLESTWPSTSTQSYLLWKKLRNVIIGVAHFKRGMSRRPLSVYSESDCDGVSRGSTEGSSADVSVPEVREPLCCDAKNDDVASTGGRSDVGYSSMNTDDTQKSSSSISSSSQLTATDREFSESGNNLASPPPVETQIIRTVKSSLKQTTLKEKSAQRMLKFDDMDFSEADEFRSRVGSIVQKSKSTLRSLHGERNERDVESPAGILITGRNSIFEEEQLSEGSSARRLYWRRRHHSASEDDHPCTRRYKIRHRSGPEGDHGRRGSEGVCGGDHPERKLLRSDSFGNDSKILSQLSAGGSDESSDEKLADSGLCVDKKLEASTQSTPTSQNDVIDVSLSSSETPVVKNRSPKTVKKIRKMSVYSGPSVSSPEPSPLPVSDEPPGEPPSETLGEPQEPPMPSEEPSLTRLTPVTQNDPLGLFAEAGSTTVTSGTNSATQVSDSKISPDVLNNNNNNNKHKESWFDFDALKTSIRARAGSLTNSDILGKVPKSATFCHSPQHTARLGEESRLEVSLETKKRLPRSSSTLPEAAHVQPPARSTSASSLMSPSISNLVGLKFSFNPSPRKADFLMGLKSAASSFGNKLTEIKEAISSTGMQQKLSGAEKPSLEQKLSYEEETQTQNEIQHRISVDYLSRSNLSDEFSLDELDNLLGEARHSRSLTTLPQDGKGSLPTLHDIMSNIQEKSSNSSQESNNIALEIIMTSCSRCYSCSSLLYDEEIMIGWTAEESNLNTKCQFCESKLVPFLLINLKDHRTPHGGKLSAAQSIESVQSSQSVTSLMVQRESTENRPESGLVLGTSVESDNFLLLEDSPESASLSSGISSPLGSPQKQPTTEGKCRTVTATAADHHPLLTSKQKSPERGSNFVVTNGSRAHELNFRRSQTHMATLEENPVEVDGNVVRDSSEPVPVTGALSLGSSHGSSFSDPLTSKLESGSDSSPSTLDPISVPYLSPIVLRKEMENVLEHEGDSCLCEPRFVDEHPIIYWNLVWFFKRIDVPSHVPGLCLNAESVIKDRQFSEAYATADSSNVLVRCMWDNPKLHEDIGQPMYLLWNQKASESPLVNALVTEPKILTQDVMQRVISSVQRDDLLEPMKLLLSDSQKKRTTKKRHHSIYRDILFLALAVLGNENISQHHFEREYRRAFDKLPQLYVDLMRKCDYPPSVGVILCRLSFQDLEL